jgi:hypothetical protein
MSETGLRRRAVSWLLVQGVMDEAGEEPLRVCRTVEKGLVVRSFVLSSETKTLLIDYIRNVHPVAVM